MVYGYKLRQQGIFQQSPDFNNIPCFGLHNHILIWQSMVFCFIFKTWSSPKWRQLNVLRLQKAFSHHLDLLVEDSLYLCSRLQHNLKSSPILITMYVRWEGFQLQRTENSALSDAVRVPFSLSTGHSPFVDCGLPHCCHLARWRLLLARKSHLPPRKLLVGGAKHMAAWTPAELSDWVCICSHVPVCCLTEAIATVDLKYLQIQQTMHRMNAFLIVECALWKTIRGAKPSTTNLWFLLLGPEYCLIS